MIPLHDRKAPASRPLAALVHDGRGVAEALLGGFIGSLQERGWRVGGLLQATSLSPPGRRGGGGRRRMELVDVALGTRYLISQDLGPGSVSCCLDAQGVVAASEVLRRAVAERPDLIVANRYGKLEAEGSGLRHEMALAAQAGLPLVTAVARDFLPDWWAYTHGLADELPPTPEALEAWWRGLAIGPAGRLQPKGPAIR